MDKRGASPLRIILAVAALLVAFVFITMGQLYFAGALIVAALILGFAALFARARTPSD